MSTITESLSPGWAVTKLDELVTAPIVYGILQPGPDAPEGVPYVRPTEIEKDVIQVADVRRTSGRIAQKYRRSSLEPADIILSIVGTIGKVALVPASLNGGNITQSSARVRVAREALLPEFAAYALRSPLLRRQYDAARLGTAVARLNLAHVRELQLPIAPLPEQRLIVDAIDSYLTRLDDAVVSLERAQAKLKAYRASVLKAAVEGRLVPTEASLALAEKRAYEPAEVLLARILKERRRCWQEAEVSKLRASGKAPKDDKWKAKYLEPPPPDTSTLPQLPEGWCWATVDMLASVKGGLTKGQRRDAKDLLLDVPYLRVANVQRGHLDLSEVKTIKATRGEIDELRLVPGDVLFNEGGDRDKLGRGWIWNGEIETCIHQNHVFRARIFTKDYEPRLLSWYGNSSGQRYFFDEGKQTTNLASINLTKLKLLPVPIPPKDEQGRIADEVERVLSVADESIVAITHDMKRCTRLRQAVLKWAFEGKLVGQDPNDEPVEHLLARIRSERAAAAPSKRAVAKR